MSIVFMVVIIIILPSILSQTLRRTNEIKNEINEKQSVQNENEIQNENENESKNDCSRIFPSPGHWINEPPYWLPNNCHTEIFNITSTISCLKNRTIYVIGNSVPRQFAFGLIDMLGGGSVKREGQRDFCPKHETFWGDSCHKEFAGVKIRYLFLLFYDGLHYKG